MPESKYNCCEIAIGSLREAIRQYEKGKTREYTVKARAFHVVGDGKPVRLSVGGLHGGEPESPRGYLEREHDAFTYVLEIKKAIGDPERV